jgi:hypothetical protein
MLALGRVGLIPVLGLMRILLAALALVFASGVVQAAEPHLTGTYSSLRYGTEDVTGVEVTVVFGGNAHYVIVQCAEGAPGVPEVAVAQLHGRELSFQLSAKTLSECPTTEFRGTISSKGLTGTFKGTDWPRFLKRGRSYWQ